MIPKDYKERLAAAVPSDKNIIVEAGAGTGKTTLLADRLCYLILGKNIKLDEIVALTFTEKAAAEIKLRLMETMRDIIADLSSQNPRLEITKNLTEGKYFKNTKKELAQKIELTFDLIERAQICTIHSFALQLLRLYPLEAGLAPQTEIDSGFISSYIFNKNWSVFLEEELILTNPRRSLWEKLLTEFGLEELKNFALLLRKPYFKYCRFLSSKQELNDFLLFQIEQAKSLFSSKDTSKKRKAEKNLEQIIKRFEELLKNLNTLNKEELLNLPEQEEISHAGLVIGWTKEEIGQINTWADMVNTLTPKKMDLLEQAYNLFSSFVQKVEKEIKQKNVISYDESILLARDLVQKNLSVRKELQRRYKSLLIDEFQDTDMAQGQLLLFLAEDKNSAAKEWQDIILEQGKLFVVGDPKQSIYRFRGANISAYEKFLELMRKQQALPCFLTTNFRSHGKIIDFVNKWGAFAIKEQKLIQAPYIPLQAGLKEEGEKPQFLQITCEEKPKQDDLRKNEANIVASWIKENVGSKKLADGKTLSYKDITILYSAGTAMNYYTDALKRFNIPYNLEASGNFYEAQEIIDIINILKVIYDPQDKLALIGVLRSPLCAMKDEELLELWQQKALNIFAKNFEASAAVKNLYKLLKSLNAQAGRITLKALLEEIFYKNDLLLLQTLATSSDQALANLQKFERIALENAAKGITLGQFLLYIQVYGRKEEEESQTSLIEENFDVVNLMSIHKSKGLQAPVIIIIDTGHKESSKKEESYIDTLSGQIGLKLGSLKNLNYFILEQQEILHRKAQNERLLYVALTRAEQKLLICVSQQITQGNIEKSLRQALCYPSPQGTDNALFTTASFAYKDPQSFLLQKREDLIRKNNLDFSSLPLLWQKRKKEFSVYQEQESVAPSELVNMETKAQAALYIGTLVHKSIDIYFQTGIFDLSLAAKLTDITDTDLLLPAQKIIDNFAKGKILKELKNMKFLGSEIPFNMYDNGILVNGVIDALFEDTNGVLFIVDFKTDKIENKDLKTYSLKYKQQLDIYEQAVKKMFKNRKIKKALAYLNQDLLFEI